MGFLLRCLGERLAPSLGQGHKLPNVVQKTISEKACISSVKSTYEILPLSGVSVEGTVDDREGCRGPSGVQINNRFQVPLV
jgi:hypothetical protein